MKKRFLSLFVLFIIAAGILIKSTDFNFDISRISTQSALIVFAIVTISGIIDSINPCAISVLFISISFLIGLGYQRKKIIAFGLLYILGIYLSYFFIGIGIFKTLGAIGVPTNLILKFFAFVLILLGANELIKHINPKKSVKLQISNFIKPTLAKLTQRASLPAIFFLGVLVGIFEFPCTGGPYLFVLSLLQAKGTLITGILYLLYYNFLFVLPLLIILYFVYKIEDLQKIQQKSQTLQKYSKLFTPVILIILGILMLIFYK
ncbi:MAG: cytochrome c biogenesis protein CcdA [Patescibacteria group bacterium]